MTNVPDVQWSTDVSQASWIAERLAPFGTDVITSVIPAGFEAYARILHPIEAGLAGKAAVRWADVAEWSGAEMTPGVQLHDIAIPEHDPVGPPPGQGSGPGLGSLNGDDAAALVDILPELSNPGSCWFALWEGHGWDNQVMLTALAGASDAETTDAQGQQPNAPSALSTAPATVPDPIPAAVRTGPRVELPSRSYLLYSGDVSAALAWVESEQQTPNLWWAADRSWCVASEIDLRWTYVGGPASLIERILADERLEAQPADPGEGFQLRATGHVARLIDEMVAELFDTGTATRDTPHGTITAELRLPKLLRSGSLDIAIDGPNSGSSGGSMLPRKSSVDLRDRVRETLTQQVCDDLATA